MADKSVISGYEFWNGTKLGTELKKVLPPKLTRVIIDIQLNDAVRIYYASVETGPILNLNWDEVVEQFEVVKPAGKNEPTQCPRGI